MRRYIDNDMIRKYIDKIQPDIDLSFFPPGSDKPEPIPINLNFFWPDLGSSK